MGLKSLQTGLAGHRPRWRLAGRDPDRAGFTMGVKVIIKPSGMPPERRDLAMERNYHYHSLPMSWSGYHPNFRVSWTLFDPALATSKQRVSS
jgi:hypothetical protein